MMIRHFVDVRRRKSRAMVLGGEEGLVFEVTVEGEQVEHVLEFNYIGFCLMNYKWSRIL